MAVKLQELNKMSQQDFTNAIGSVFEHSPWIAEEAWHNKPYSSVDELHKTMANILENADEKKKLDLLRAHPDLASSVTMTSESVSEQKGAGLDQLTNEEKQEMLNYNETYKEKFGFPFILAVRNHNSESIKNSIKQRVENDRAEEMETALQEIFKIARFRMGDLIKEN